MTTCTDCYEQIPDQELVWSEGMEGLPGSPYHSSCYEKMQVAHSADVNRRILAQKLEEQEKENLEVELRLNLSKGKWFLKGAETICQINPLYYDRMKTWWVWNDTDKFWQERDETDILVMIRATLQTLGDTTVRHNARLLEALKQVARQREPIEPPVSYIQLGTTLYDIITGDEKPSTPDYFSTNRVPWNVGTTDATPRMDALIDSWVGPEYRQTVYELIAYCIYRDYPIHRIFCLVGTGANGKTRLMKLIEKFVGEHNKASLSIHKMNTNNFAIYPLFRKTVCFIGETTHHRLESTDLLKRLSGQDPIDFESKGKNSFTGTNYAKLIVGTNVLPPSTDTSRGWYRRWMIINFPNEFQEGEDVLSTIPETEYENLARKSIQLLPMLIRRGGFHNEGTIEDRKQRYVDTSTPIKKFLDTHYVRLHNENVRYTELYIAFIKYLADLKLRRITKQEFSALLEDEGLEVQRTSIWNADTRNTTTISIVWGLQRMETPKNDAPMQPMRTMQPFHIASNFPLREIETDIETAHSSHSPHRDINVSVLETFLTVIRDLKVAKKDELQATFPEINLEDLLSQGVIYEPKPGTIKVVE